MDQKALMHLPAAYPQVPRQWPTLRGRSSGRSQVGWRAASGLLCFCLAPQRARRTARGAQAKELVVCYDFDGVVCDSVDESSTAAWKHGKQLWPGLRWGDSPEAFLEPMRLLRPVVETGWENTLIMRLLAEAELVEAARLMQSRPPKKQVSLFDEEPKPGQVLMKNLGMAGQMCKSVLAGWEALRDEKVAELDLDVEELIRGFGEVRDAWRSEDLASWFSCNKAYGTVPDVMAEMLDRGAQVFVITTKQKRFAKALLEDYDVPLAEDHLYALEDGPKTEVLKGLVASYSQKEFHFIEDKLGTLRKVLQEPELKKVNLHLASWGYCTQQDVDVVKAGLLEVSLLTQKDLETLGVDEPWIY